MVPWWRWASGTEASTSSYRDTQRVGRSLHAHSGGVEDLDFSSNGRQLASVGDDGKLELWNLGKEPSNRELWDSSDVLWGVRFSPDGSTLASAGEDGTVRLWDVAKEAAIGGPLIHRTGDLLRLAFSPDGRGLVAGNGEARSTAGNCHPGNLCSSR
jgi:WD40 repeat protein